MSRKGSAFEDCLAVWLEKENVSADAIDQLCQHGYTSLNNLGVAYGGAQDDIIVWEGDDARQLNQLRQEVPALTQMLAMKLLKHLSKHKQGKLRRKRRVNSCSVLLTLMVLAVGIVVGAVLKAPPHERHEDINRLMDLMGKKSNEVRDLIDAFVEKAADAAANAGVKGLESFTSRSAEPKVVLVGSGSLVELADLLIRAQEATVFDLQGKSLKGVLKEPIQVTCDGITIRQGSISISNALETLLLVSGDGFRMESVSVQGSMDQGNDFEAVGLVHLKRGREAVLKGCSISGGAAALSLQAGASAEVSNCALSGVSVSGSGTKLVMRRSAVSKNPAMGVVVGQGAHVQVFDTNVTACGKEGLSVSNQKSILVGHRLVVTGNNGGALWVGDGGQAEMFATELQGGDADSVLAIGDGSTVKLHKCQVDNKPTTSINGRVDVV